mgnify:CR=1 FL=1
MEEGEVAVPYGYIAVCKLVDDEAEPNRDEVYEHDEGKQGEGHRSEY